MKSELKPILLLDDIFDRIDGDRIQKFIEMIKENQFGQIFITDSHKERIEEVFRDVKDNLYIFMVKNGAIVD